MTARLSFAVGASGAIIAFFVALPVEARERSGDELVAICASCHRLDGRDQGIPSIVGLPVNDLVSAMWVFKSDERENATMHAMSLALSDEETAAIARRLATMGTTAPR